MTPPLVCGDSCVLFVCTLSMTGKSTLYKRRGHFILSIPKSEKSERNNDVRAEPRFQPCGDLFCFAIADEPALPQTAEQGNNAEVAAIIS